MSQITCTNELLEIIQKPGVIGVKNGDKIENINTAILRHTPIMEVIKSLHNNQLYKVTPCRN